MNLNNYKDLHEGLKGLLLPKGYKIEAFKTKENGTYVKFQGKNLSTREWVNLTDQIMYVLDILYITIKRISGFGREFIVVYGY